jgi:NADH:ubiquinone oxidoreductase subunit 6 (subunit J)
MQVLRMYISLYLFAVLVAMELLLSAYIFRVKELLHAVVLLALVFATTSLLYLIASQPLLATIQLLVLVGGISMYLLVGTASESFSKFKHTNMALMLVLAAVLFAVIAYPVISSPGSYASSTTTSFSIQQQSQFVGNDLVIFYIIALLLSGISIGAIALYKKLGGSKWQ